MLWMLYAVCLATVIIFIYYLTCLGEDKQEAPNVIRLSEKRKEMRRSNKSGQQACSSCRKKAGKLAFFTDPSGRVVGICHECRMKEERKEWMRL